MDNQIIYLFIIKDNTSKKITKINTYIILSSYIIHLFIWRKITSDKKFHRKFPMKPNKKYMKRKIQVNIIFGTKSTLVNILLWYERGKEGKELKG